MTDIAMAWTYLCIQPIQVRGKSILELGSGPGLVGIAAAILGSKEVILSDLSYALPLMKRNVELNKSTIESAQCEKIDCIEINWFSPPDIDSLYRCKKFPEVILIADCVWLEELVTPLMDTLEKYCIGNHQIEVIITYQRRGKAADVLFWERVRRMFTSITAVDTLNDCGIDKPDFLTLLICKR
jgi:Predicted methyltransferase